MKKLTFSITETQRTEFRGLFRQKGVHQRGEVYLDRLINLHFAEEHAAALRGDKDELDSAEAALVIRAGQAMLARNPRTNYAGLIEEMEDIRRTNPPAGIPKKEHWLRALLRFGET